MTYDVIFEKFPFVRVSAEDKVLAIRAARRKAAKIIVEEKRDQIALDLRVIQIKPINDQ